MSEQEFSSPTPLSTNDSLIAFVFLALVVHIGLILGINFTESSTEKASKSIEITLVTNEAKKSPKKAEFLAQNNQIAAGAKHEKPAPAAQKIASSGAKAKAPPRKKVVKRQSVAKQQVITQKVAEEIVETSPKVVKTSEQATPKLSMDALYQQVSELGAQIRYQKPSSKQNRIKFVNSVSAHKYLASQYISDWQRKIESMGNLNYPTVAKREGFNSSLIMDVGIKADGSIYSLRINKSSGYPALDEAAQRIVRLSAPFPPLPAVLLQELDVLVITRVWKFSDESGFEAD